MRVASTLVLGVLVYLSYAQIDTDRPAYTNTPSTVPAKTLQLEGGLHGFFKSPTSSSFSQSWNLPSTVMRYGVSKNTELRLELPSLGFSRVTRNDTVIRENIELNNLSFGLKSGVYEGKRFNISSITTLTFIEQSEEWIATPLEVGLNVSLPMSFSINDKSSVAGSVGLRLQSTFTYLSYSVLYGRYLKPRIWVQAEYYAIAIDFGAGTFDNLYWNDNINLSSQFTLSDYTKADVTIGSVLTSPILNNNFSDNPNLRIQAGLSYAFHKK